MSGINRFKNCFEVFEKPVGYLWTVSLAKASGPHCRHVVIYLIIGEEMQSYTNNNIIEQAVDSRP